LTINFNEVLTGYRPKRATEIAYDQSTGGTGTGFRDIYIMGEIVAAGSASEGDISEPFADADAGVAFFGSTAGADSFGAYMVRQVFRRGSLGALKNRVYGVACAEPGAGVAATAEFDIVGNAGSAGTWTVNVGGAVFSWNVSTNDTPTVSGAAMIAAFNALAVDRKPPCTISQAAGVITLTMNNKGAVANSCPTYVITTGEEPTTQTLAADSECFAGAATPPVAGTLYHYIRPSLRHWLIWWRLRPLSCFTLGMRPLTAARQTLI
jgi:phage tail sheath gpL-like